MTGADLDFAALGLGPGDVAHQAIADQASAAFGRLLILTPGHSEALRAYRRCRELLTRFLGIPPNAKTQALYHSVRERAAYAPVGSAL